MDDKRFDRIEQKIDLLIDRVGSIDTTLAAQHVSLVEHMRRTMLLEKIIVPIKKHVDTMQGLAKVILLGSAVAAIIELAQKILK